MGASILRQTIAQLVFGNLARRSSYIRTPTPIVISTPWVLPSNTHLIGEGDGPFGTTIQDASGTAFVNRL